MTNIVRGFITVKHGEPLATHNFKDEKADAILRTAISDILNGINSTIGQDSTNKDHTNSIENQNITLILGEILLLIGRSLEEAKKLFIELVIDIERQTGICPFKQIVEGIAPQGKGKLGLKNNLSGLLKNDLPKETIDTFPSNLQQIAKFGTAIFGNIGEAWLNTEREKLTNARKLEGNVQLDSVQELPPNSIEVEQGIYGLYIDDIAKANVFFRLSEDDDTAMPVAWCVKSEFLDLIKERQWLEALPSLNLSSKGPHFILFKKTDKKAPILITSALMHNTDALMNWLINQDFFHDGEWETTIQTKEFKESFLKFMNSLGHIITLDMCTWKNLREFEQFLLDFFGPNGIGESIRLTINSKIGNKKERFKHFYNTLWLCFKTCAEIGKKVTVSVMDAKPPLRLFDLIGAHSGEEIFINYSINIIEGAEVGKIIIDNQKAWETMSNLGWEKIHALYYITKKIADSGNQKWTF